MLCRINWHNYQYLGLIRDLCWAWMRMGDCVVQLLGIWYADVPDAPCWNQWVNKDTHTPCVIAHYVVKIELHVVNNGKARQPAMCIFNHYQTLQSAMLYFRFSKSYALCLVIFPFCLIDCCSCNCMYHIVEVTLPPSITFMCFLSMKGSSKKSKLII